MDLENNILKEKTLSVIIVSYNSQGYLKSCLDSLIAASPDLDYEIIVVDNNSTDGSAALVKKKYAHVRLIQNSSNEGFSKATNQAIRFSSSAHILLLNSDCEVFGGSLEKMIDFASVHEKIAVLGPKILNSDGSLQLSCRKFPSFFTAAAHLIMSSLNPNNSFSNHYKMAHIDKSRPFAVDWVSGSCMLIKRAALADTGLFDENYFMYVEDTDLCRRMWQKGWQVYYFPYSQVMHHVGKSTNDGQTRACIRMQKSVLYYFLKYNKRSIKVLLTPFLLIVLGLKIVLTFLKDNLKKNKDI